MSSAVSRPLRFVACPSTSPSSASAPFREISTRLRTASSLAFSISMVAVLLPPEIVGRVLTIPVSPVTPTRNVSISADVCASTSATVREPGAGRQPYLSSGITCASESKRLSRPCRGIRISTAGIRVFASLMSSSSTSKTSSDFPGIGPVPASPYASWYGMNKRRLPPTFMPSSPISQPVITCRRPCTNSNGSFRSTDESNLFPSVSQPL